MNDFGNEEFDEEERITTINFKPSFVLIAIDTHPSMFETIQDDDGNETHPFKEALTACYEIADSLIFSTSRSNYNQFGVILANEDQKASLVEVENNLLDSVKVLKQKCSRSKEELKSKYERVGDLDLAAFLLLCKKKFKEIKAAYYQRTLLYITNDDNPAEDAQKKFAALNEAKTFEASDINFEIVTMNLSFDYTKFYNELFHLYSKPPVADEICKNKDGLIEKLSSSIVSRYRKLRYSFYPYKNDFSRYLKVMKVNFIREAIICNTHKASIDNKLLIKVKEDPATREQEPLTFELDLNNAKLELDLKDKYDIFANDLPLGLHLQYVSKRLTDYGMAIDQMSLIILDPKEELAKYFEQFWHYCAKNKKVMVCIWKYKHPQELRYVELIPKYANKQKIFLLKNIPFCEELKIYKELKTADPLPSNVTDTQRAAIRQLVDNLACDYDPKMFLNPSYNKKKAYVKAKLLDLPEEEVDDPTNCVDLIDEQIKDIVEKLNGHFNLSVLAQGTKRKAPASSGSGRGRKAAK